MPAKRLGDQPVQVSRYDVLAQDSADIPRFIRHVGLADEDQTDVIRSSNVRMVHMGPPLSRGDGENPVDAVGFVGLGAAQIRQISIFVDEHISEYEAEKLGRRQQYVILPHVREPDATCSCRRFNCAGFVIEAYRYTGMNLIDTNLETLPSVSLETLCKAFPDVATILQNRRAREKYGLQGEGPWPVVLAGYVLNSLDRSVGEIEGNTYIPKSGDEFFPRPAEEGDLG